MQPAPPTDIPPITNNTSTQEVMTILLGRVEKLERRCQAQELANDMLREAIKSGGNAQDRFDELSSRIVQTERRSDRHDKKVSDFVKRLSTLATSQSRSLKMINVLTQKVNAISTVAWNKTSEDGSEVQAVSFDSIVEEEIPERFIPGVSRAAVQTYKEALDDSLEDTSADNGLSKLIKERADGPKVAKRKTMLKNQKLKDRSMQTIIEPKETSTFGTQTSAPLHSNDPASMGENVARDQEMTQVVTPGVVPMAGKSEMLLNKGIMEEYTDSYSIEEHSQVTLDSSAMIEEYVMEKLETLEKRINEMASDGFARNSDSRPESGKKSSDDNASNIEEVRNDLSGGIPDVALSMNTNPIIMKENAFKMLLRDTKEAWDQAFEELKKKVTKMDEVISQMGTKPDDLHRRLSAFKDKVTNALEVISVALPESRQDIIASIYDTMEDVRQDALEVVALEEEVRNFIENKNAGDELTVSQIPTHLPELLNEACAKTTEVLGERIEKYDLAKRLDELTEIVNNKVDIPIFLTMEEDIRIALTLKADQKQMQCALDKKSSVSDMQKFREYITDEIDSMRAMLANSTQKSIQNTGASTAEFEGMTSALNERMDKLFRNLQDTTTRINGFVPRQEIETALQALLNEVKAVKSNYVEKKTLEDQMQHKADNDEVERLLSILRGTVGDPLSVRQAAIQKCLVCDKPVNPFNQQSSNRPGSPTTYYDKVSDSPPKQRPQTTTGVPRSMPEKLRQTAEMNILRNSMESLPALDDSRLSNTASSSQRASNRSNNLSAHSRRIRSAAGGGLGPSFQQDSR